MLELDDPIVASILDQGRTAFVGATSPAGPHLTPEPYSVADGRLWFWTAPSTIKARALLREPRVGATIVGRGRAAVLWGDAEAFDPWDLRTIPRLLRQPRTIGLAALRYGRRHLARLAGEIGRGRVGPVLVGVWPSEVHVVDGPPAGGARDAVLAWETARGPRVYPCRLDRTERRLWLRPELPGLDALPSPARIAVARDGRVCRGTAQRGDDGVVDFEPERSTRLERAIRTRRRR